MPKIQPLPRNDLAIPKLVRKKSIERDLPQAKHHAKLRQQSNLLIKPRRAIALLFRRGLVIRRSAVDDRADPNPT